MNLAVSIVRTDGGTQPRSAISADTVSEYAVAMLEGAAFPPVDVYYDGESYWLADGFHRLAAAREASLEEIAANVHQGTREDAQWHSFGANQHHGLRRSNEDKQRAVKAALCHPKSIHLSDSQIAKHLGLDVKTIGNWRSRLQPSLEFPKIENRTVTRNGTTYQQNTANIGRKKTTNTVIATMIESPAADTIISPPAPVKQANIPTLTNKQAWDAQDTKKFKREMLRLIRSYEKAHPAITAMMLRRGVKGIEDIEIVSEGVGA